MIPRTRLRRVEAALQLSQDEALPRHFQCWIGDPLPFGFTERDLIIWLPKKSTTEEEWITLTHELLQAYPPERDGYEPDDDERD
jgi:hypothetical protein